MTFEPDAFWKRTKCKSCGEDFAFARTLREPDLCPPCADGAKRQAQLRTERDALLRNIDQRVSERLLAAGMSPRESTAVWARIPGELRSLVDQSAPGARELLAGELPRVGFGLCGATGTGKSFAMSVMVRALLREAWTKRANIGFAATKSPTVAWVRWPEMVNRLRVMSARDGGVAMADDMMRPLATIDVLVLDDVGSERLRGPDDWTASLLELLVDDRFNTMRPTWWTSNSMPKELLQRYGARMWSRLASMNPPLVVRPSKDMRFASSPVDTTTKGGANACS